MAKVTIVTPPPVEPPPSSYVLELSPAEYELVLGLIAITCGETAWNLYRALVQGRADRDFARFINSRKEKVSYLMVDEGSS